MRSTLRRLCDIKKLANNALGTFRIADPIDPARVGQEVTLRARVSRTRVKGKKIGFVHLRQSPVDSIQAIADREDLVACVKQLTPETIVEVRGTLKATDSPVQSASCRNHELIISELTTISASATPLPFPIGDATTNLNTRLDHRIIDQRTVQTGLVMRITSEVNRLFREYLSAQDFIEIHTPKTIGTPSEGGANIFSLKYFDKEAYLAQSPQLYKQMVLMGDAMRVFEIGPVFRAENSITHRHATEFVGFDAELVIRDHYFEVLDVLEGTITHIVRGMQTGRVAKMVEQLNATLAEPPSPIVATVSGEVEHSLGLGEEVSTGEVTRPSTDKYGGRLSRETRVLRLSFRNAAKLLADSGVVTGANIDDFSTAQEKQLGALIKARYGVDVYVVDQFKVSARPFYTMLQGEDETRSYDMYLRGEEICSGAQRISDPELLRQRAAACNVNTELIKDYIDSFKFGAWPHGGFGLGMERIVMFFLGLSDIRQVALFPRDPRRITP